MDGNTEKTTGTSLTPVAEYTETALALAELQGRFKDLIVDVSTPKGLKVAKADVADLRTLRTSLEKRRKELKDPILERGRLLDNEAKRITGEILALEEPLKRQVDAKEAELEAARLAKLEVDRLRLVAIMDKIQGIRDVPGSLVGKPSVIIAGQLAKLQAMVLDENELAEHYVTATDALTAAVARVQDLLAAQHEAEAEQRRIADERAELERMRAENERLQREAEERRIADEQRAAAERAEQDRLAQVERDRIAAEEAAARAAEQAARDEAARVEQQRIDEIRARIDGIRCMATNVDGFGIAELEETRRALIVMHPDDSGADFAEYRDQAVDVWDTAEATLSQAIEQRQEREREKAALQAERERQAAAQKKLDEQAAQLKRDREAATKKAEAERLANIGLREAAVDVMSWAEANGHETAKPFRDLRAALANDAAKNLAKPVRTKKRVAA